MESGDTPCRLAAFLSGVQDAFAKKKKGAGTTPRVLYNDGHRARQTPHVNGNCHHVRFVLEKVPDLRCAAIRVLWVEVSADR